MKATKKIKDERMVELNQKLKSEAFVIIMILTIVSLLFKVFILDNSIKKYFTELLIILISTLYLALRGTTVGYYSTDDSERNKKILITGIILVSIFNTVVTGINNYSTYTDKYSGILDGHFLSVLIFTLITSILFMSVIIGVIHYVEEYAQKRLEKKWGVEED